MEAEIDAALVIVEQARLRTGAKREHSRPMPRPVSSHRARCRDNAAALETADVFPAMFGGPLRIDDRAAQRRGLGNHDILPAFVVDPPVSGAVKWTPSREVWTIR